jgi:hypothetical protein
MFPYIYILGLVYITYLSLIASLYIEASIFITYTTQYNVVLRYAFALSLSLFLFSLLQSSAL